MSRAQLEPFEPKVIELEVGPEPPWCVCVGLVTSICAEMHGIQVCKHVYIYIYLSLIMGLSVPHTYTHKKANMFRPACGLKGSHS